MKKFSAFFGAFFLLSSAFAQVGNEWINFSQSYFKIPVAKDGMYRLDYATLTASGFPVSSVDPKTIQIFHRGIEHAIYVEGEEDNTFDPTDFVEFYGQRNDGTLDSLLYRPSNLQPHKYYSLYSDTTAYFITYGATAGKRMTLFSETNDSGLPTQTYHIDERLTVLNSQYAAGTDYQLEVAASWFDKGETWSGNYADTNQSLDYTLSGITNTITTGPAPVLDIQLLGRNWVPHRIEIYVGSARRLVSTVDLDGFNFTNVRVALNWNDISSDGSLPIRVRSLVTTTIYSYISVNFMRVRYPQAVDMAGADEKIFSPKDSPVKTYIEIANSPSGVKLFDISDPTKIKRIGTTSTTSLNAVLPAGTNQKILATKAFTVPGIRQVSFRKINAADHNYIIISHPLLRQPANGYADPVQAYAEYRASAAGGSFDTLVVNVQQLYDQFTSGEATPLAIYRLMKYLSHTKTPRYLFLVGKGLDIWYKYYRNSPAFVDYKDLVPTAGFPGSDALFTAGLSGSDSEYELAVPTGRITASKASEVAAYLDKVKETEAQPFNDLTKKRILHLSGGTEAGEPERFKSHLAGMADVADGYYLGGQVSSIAKQSFSVELINIADEINKGLGLVTFFGHSSATTLDFDIGKVTNPVMGYNNKGKYPMFLINGCNVGSFFLYDFLFGEDWILAGNKGATAFIAHTGYAFEGTIKAYADQFYQVAYNDSTFISKGIGDIQKETVRRYMENASLTITNMTQVQQMVLLGDPAVPLFGARKSDLEINNENVSIESFSEGDVTALSDSLALKLIVRNFGQARPDTLQIQVKRFLNDNSVIVYDSIYPSVLYSDTLTFVIRKGRESGAGNNRFEITLDPDDVIDELNETNNTAIIEFLIPFNGTKNLYPAPFSIVNSGNVTLSFQATDVFSGEREFLLEVDTTHTFDSPTKKSFQLNGEILARQLVTLFDRDTLVYYWRTKLANPSPQESDAWSLNSFTYINNGPEGWAQVDFPQYLDNVMNGLLTNTSSRRISFKETTTPLVIKTFGGDHPAPYWEVSVKIDGAEYNLYEQEGGGFGCRDNSINLIAFDRHSTSPYMAIPFKWYNRAGRACGRFPWVINNFVYNQMVTGNGDDLIAYVDNVPAGDSVVIYNIGDAAYAYWPAAAKIKLGELGISVAQIDALAPGEAVVIFGRKGIAPGTAKVFRVSGGSPSQQQLNVSKTITGGYTSGSMTSSLIGPAMNWESFIVKHEKLDAADQISFDLIGVQLDGSEEVLMSGVTDDQPLTHISAGEYPYLKITYHTEDNVNLTATQLDKWLVIYTPVPEGLLIYDGPKEKQVLQEGDVWKGNYGFINITDKTFADSITVHLETFNQTFRSSYAGTMKIGAPLPGDTATFSYSVDTQGKTGLNDVNVFVNPRLQAEQYYDNNVLNLHSYLDVQRDLFKPVLDVTVDGRYVVNGDFVSSNPAILVKVWDENKKRRKTDPGGMRIFLTYPCSTSSCEPTFIDLGSDEITWHPATESNEFSIEFNPENLEAGVYVLRVEGADAENNSSGSSAYEVSFVVSGEESVYIAKPYPNPFKLEANFSIVLSGDDLPDEFNIQIVDLNGKPIMQLAKDQVDFHTGLNIIKWDGSSYSGNPVPGGIYVYTLAMNVGGKLYRETGKLVLLK